LGSSEAVRLGSSFGIMQGRLSPQNPRAYQAFPEKSWAGEFRLAADYGFQHIEWVLEGHLLEENPLFVTPSYVSKLANDEGVAVAAVCADFLRDAPLADDNLDSWRGFEKAIHYASEVGIQVLVVPCVDSGSLLFEENLSNLKKSLPRAIIAAEANSIDLALESDLPPDEFNQLLASFDSPNFGVNYDSGDSASLGYDFSEEMAAYGNRIKHVHLKDRVRGGATIQLGQGQADFQKVLQHLLSQNYAGMVTLQAWRDEAGIPAVQAQIDWLAKHIATDKPNHA